MDNISIKKIKEYLNNNELDFKSTHHQLSFPIINRIFKKMKNGIKFDDIKVYDNLIIDGHHRDISSLLTDYTPGRALSSKTSATIEYEWNTVIFVEEEWDTPDKIQYLNELDAEFNGITVEEIIEMIK